ncbi:hypothetical protein F4779DRAFT_621222 [Xylariaceae sp. FL0662B]|nr:hypothetical protein F4779DRAFT_621222 [Xylariaceae sp. FL0662B]
MTPTPTPANAFTVSLKAESGCTVVASVTKSTEGRNNWNFESNSVHMNSSTCTCPRAHEKVLMLENEEKLWRHAFNMWQSGKCDVPGMLDVFARHTLGMPMEERLRLEWDNEMEVWADVAEKEGAEGASGNISSQSFVGVASEEVVEAKEESKA